MTGLAMIRSSPRSPTACALVALPLPYLESASVSVLCAPAARARVRAERHQPRRRAHGVQGHGQPRLPARQPDAERLVLRSTPTPTRTTPSFHMRGARHATDSRRLLGDIVCASTFPGEEESNAKAAGDPARGRRGRRRSAVDGVRSSTAPATGSHPVAQPVIGRRSNIERFTRADLLSTCAGRNWRERRRRRGRRGSIRGGGSRCRSRLRVLMVPNRVAAPGVLAACARSARPGAARRTSSRVSDRVAGRGRRVASEVAAALFGEGMSSPLMDRYKVRAQRAV